MSTVFKIRQATADDITFVMHSWVDSYRTAHAAGLIQMSDWAGVMLPQVAKVLARPGVEVLVAANPQNAGTRADIFGWLCHERGHRRPLVHYVYVKDDFRGHGFARLLMRKAGVDPQKEFLHTCKTAVLSKLSSKIPHARWAPLMARHERKNPPLKDSPHGPQQSPPVTIRRSGRRDRGS